jgi:hypothetical protein
VVTSVQLSGAPRSKIGGGSAPEPIAESPAADSRYLRTSSEEVAMNALLNFECFAARTLNHLKPDQTLIQASVLVFTGFG